MSKSLLLFIFFLSSCAGGLKRPESINQKMERFTSKHRNVNPIPVIEFNNAISYSKKKATTRGPASVNKKSFTPFSTPKNNKKLYFLTLFEQYNTMKNLTPKEESGLRDIEHCPSFHTTWIEYKEGMKTKHSSKTPQRVLIKKDYQALIRATSKNSSSKNEMIYHPELFLSVTNRSEGPRLMDIVNPENNARQIEGYLKKALHSHVSKARAELVELCDSGASENYFIYENLTTQLNRKNFGKDSRTLQILLKTPVFFNMAIIETLSEVSPKRQSSRRPASVGGRTSSFVDKGNHSNGMIQKLKVNWAREYFRNL